jgi:hypothetical protein
MRRESWVTCHESAGREGVPPMAHLFCSSVNHPSLVCFFSFSKPLSGYKTVQRQCSSWYPRRCKPELANQSSQTNQASLLMPPAANTLLILGCVGVGVVADTDMCWLLTGVR